MKYKDFESRYKPTDEMVRTNDRQQYIEAAADARGRADPPFDTINSVLRKIKHPLTLTDKFNDGEKRNRRSMSERMFGFMVDRVWNQKRGTDGLTTEKRYPEDLMMTFEETEEAYQRNQHIAGLFRGLSEKPFEGLSKELSKRTSKFADTNPAELIRLHEELLTELDTNNTLELIEHGISDEDLVNDPEKFYRISAISQQLDTFSELFNQLETEMLDEPSRQSLQRCKDLVVKYKPFSSFLSALDERMGFIAGPYYESVDFDDPALLAAARASRNDQNPIPPNEPADPGKEKLNDMLAGVVRHSDDILNSELSAVMLKRDRDPRRPEVTAFRFIGENGTEPEEHLLFDESGHNQAYPTLANGGKRGVVIYDRNRRENVETVKSGIPDMTNTRLLARVAAMKHPPEEPFVPVKPQEMGLGARFLHAITFHLYRKQDFIDHERDVAAYNKYIAGAEERHNQWRVENALFTKLNPNYHTAVPGRLMKGSERLKLEREQNMEATLNSIRDVYGANRPERPDWVKRGVFLPRNTILMAERSYDLNTIPEDVGEVDEDLFAFLSMTMSRTPTLMDKIRDKPNTSAFDDIVMSSKDYHPREKTDYFLDRVIEPARDIVFKCLTSFNTQMPGEAEGVTGKEHMARLLAAALNGAAAQLGSKRWDTQTGAAEAELLGRVLDFAEENGMTDMLEANGMTEQAVNTIRAGQRAGELYMAGKRAEYQLAREIMDGVRLTEEQRMEAVETLSMARAMNVVSRYWNDTAPERPLELPVKMENEADAHYTARVDRYMAEYNRMDQSRTELAPQLYTYGTNDDQLMAIRNRLFPREAREQMARQGASACWNRLIGDKDAAYDEWMAMQPGQEQPPAQPENRPEAGLQGGPRENDVRVNDVNVPQAEVPANNGGQPQAEVPANNGGQPQAEVPANDGEQPQADPGDRPMTEEEKKCEEMIMALESKHPFGDEPLPDSLTNNLRRLCRDAEAGRAYIARKAEKGKSMTGGKYALDMIMYRAAQYVCESDHPDPERLRTFAVVRFDVTGPMIAEESYDLCYTTVRTHDADFFRKNLLVPDGLGKQALAFVEAMDDVIRKTDPANQTEKETADRTMNGPGEVKPEPQPQPQPQPGGPVNGQ